MIEADKRKAIYLLAQEGMTGREISRRLGASRTTVKVILEQQGAMPMIEREIEINEHTAREASTTAGDGDHRE